MSQGTVSVRLAVKFSYICCLLLVARLPRAETKPNHSPSLRKVYSNVALGFRYFPPSEMRDETENGRTEIRSRAAGRHTKKILDLLLVMSSGPDATAPDWRLLSIESYPRQAFSDLDDASAEGKMSAWVAGTGSLGGKPRFITLEGQAFAVTVFGDQDGTIRKGAVIWTTIRRHQLLSFAFVANSPDQLKALTETMKTVEFF